MPVEIRKGGVGPRSPATGVGDCREPSCRAGNGTRVLKEQQALLFLFFWLSVYATVSKGCWSPGMAASPSVRPGKVTEGLCRSTN